MPRLSLRSILSSIPGPSRLPTTLPRISSLPIRSLSFLSIPTRPSPFSLVQSTITSTITTNPPLSLFSNRQPLQTRHVTYGMEYQPSQRKRKRKHGFLVRLRGGRLGMGILRRRRAVGRRFLSH